MKKLKKCDVFSLADLVQKCGGEAAYMIRGFFIQEGHRLGMIEGMEVEHATYDAIWERIDGAPFVPKQDYRESVIAEIVYCFGFLWDVNSSLWIRGYSDGFPSVDPLYGISARDLSRLLDSVADVKRKSVYRTTREFFELPEIQTAYAKHIRETIKEIYFTGKANHIHYYRSLVEAKGLSYEDIREGTQAYHEGKKKIIMPILWDMVDNGDLIFDESTQCFMPAGKLKDEINRK